MRLDEDLDYERDDGVNAARMLVGKAAAIAESSHRREKREYAKLFHRLACRNYARKRRAADKEGCNRYLRAWRAKNRSRVRAKERARRAAKRKPIILICQHCGKSFSPKRYRRAKWCSRACSNAHHCKARVIAKNRGLRNMGLEGRILAALGDAPWLTPGELRAKLPFDKKASIATKLTDLVKSGEIIRRGPDGRIVPAGAKGAKGLRYARRGAKA